MLKFLISLFIFLSQAVAATDLQELPESGCEPRLIHSIDSEVKAGKSLAYFLDNFLGRYELRFQVFPEGTQVVLLPVSTKNLTTMQKLLSVSLKHHFGDRYSLNKPARAFSEASRHGWIAVPASEKLGATLLHVINSFEELPLFKTLTAFGLSRDEKFRRMAERYMQRHFPGISDVKGLNAMLNTFPYFVERLPVMDRLFADDSILSLDDEQPKTNLFLESLVGFLFEEKVNSVDVRLKLRAQFHKLLTDLLPSYSANGSSFDWNSVKPDIHDEIALQTNSRVAVGRIVTPSHQFAKSKSQKREVISFIGRITPQLTRAVDNIEWSENEFGSWSTKISDLKLRPLTRQKLTMSGAVYMYELLGKFTAKDLVEKLELSREQMLELMDELNVHGFDLHIDGDWDRDTLRLRRDRPEYYNYSHVPNQPWLRWDLIDQDKDNSSK